MDEAVVDLRKQLKGHRFFFLLKWLFLQIMCLCSQIILGLSKSSSFSGRLEWVWSWLCFCHQLSRKERERERQGINRDHGTCSTCYWMPVECFSDCPCADDRLHMQSHSEGLGGGLRLWVPKKLQLAAAGPQSTLQGAGVRHSVHSTQWVHVKVHMFSCSIDRPPLCH